MRISVIVIYIMNIEKETKQEQKKLKKLNFFFIKNAILHIRICHVIWKKKLTFDSSSPTYRCTYLPLNFILNYY